MKKRQIEIKLSQTCRGKYFKVQSYSKYSRYVLEIGEQQIGCGKTNTVLYFLYMILFINLIKSIT